MNWENKEKICERIVEYLYTYEYTNILTNDDILGHLFNAGAFFNKKLENAYKKDVAFYLNNWYINDV